MKNILSILFCVALLFSCTDQAINLDQKDAIPYDVAFATADRCELAIIGCYDAAQSGYYPGNNQRRGYPFGAASVEQGDMKGELMVNVQQVLISRIGDIFFQYHYLRYLPIQRLQVNKMPAGIKHHYYYFVRLLFGAVLFFL